MIFQVTLGYSFNKCSFCNMYRTKEYTERRWEEVKLEIDLAANAYPETRRVFLADGDALNIPADRLEKILEYLYCKFTKLERISCYAMPKNLLQKKNEELSRLRTAGLRMFYVGIETGNDILLKKVTKEATSRRIIQSCQRARGHNYILSCMIISGLGGRTYTSEHIDDTAKVVSEVSPDYLAALNLQLEDEIYNEFMSKFAEPFVVLGDTEILNELERLVSNIKPINPIIFRANHASNVYSLGGTLPEDKEKILSLIRGLKVRPELLKPKILRRF
jgi:radical SAM superfamily enzyme YgiQ (UPF0313 family)